MSSIHTGNIKSKLYIGQAKVKKGYLGAAKVYSSGNIVTYHVDTGRSYTEEVDSEASCLSPTTFTPAREGYTFAGWRTDTAADGNVLTGKIMGDDPVVLYAVFTRTITLTLYNNSASPSTLTGACYYNNGNLRAPQFTQEAAERNEWRFRGWSDSPQPEGSILYPALSGAAISENCKLYGIYQKEITLTLYNNTEVISRSGYAYYNSSGTVTNPAFSQKENLKDDWTFRGWAVDSAGDATIDYNSISHTVLSQSMTLYACYHRTVYLYYGKDEQNYVDHHVEGTCYLSSSGQCSPAVFTVEGCAISNPGYTFRHWKVFKGDDIYLPEGKVAIDEKDNVLTLVGVWLLSNVYWIRDSNFTNANEWTNYTGQRDDWGISNESSILTLGKTTSAFGEGGSAGGVYSGWYEMEGYHELEIEVSQMNNATLYIETDSRETKEIPGSYFSKYTFTFQNASKYRLKAYLSCNRWDSCWCYISNIILKAKSPYSQ